MGNGYNPFPLLILNEEVILLVEYFIIGKIINVHGIKGELKVMPETDDPTRFKKLKKVRVELKGLQLNTNANQLECIMTVFFLH